MTKVCIYKPSKNAMQSGRAKCSQWVMEFDLETARTPESLMGWVSSGDTLNQVKLRFDTVEEAVTHAKDKGYEYTVLPEHDRIVRPRNYLDNFKYVPPKASGKAT